MMAHNLCYSSLLLDNRVIETHNLKRDVDYIVTPSGGEWCSSREEVITRRQVREIDREERCLAHYFGRLDFGS